LYISIFGLPFRYKSKANTNILCFYIFIFWLPFRYKSKAKSNSFMFLYIYFRAAVSL